MHRRPVAGPILAAGHRAVIDRHVVERLPGLHESAAEVHQPDFPVLDSVDDRHMRPVFLLPCGRIGAVTGLFEEVDHVTREQEILPEDRPAVGRSPYQEVLRGPLVEPQLFQERVHAVVAVRGDYCRIVQDPLQVAADALAPPGRTERSLAAPSVVE